MTLQELITKIERIQELRKIPYARLTESEMYELDALEDMEVKSKQRYEEWNNE